MYLICLSLLSVVFPYICLFSVCLTLCHLLVALRPPPNLPNRRQGRVQTWRTVRKGFKKLEYWPGRVRDDFLMMLFSQELDGWGNLPPPPCLFACLEGLVLLEPSCLHLDEKDVFTCRNPSRWLPAFCPVVKWTVATCRTADVHWHSTFCYLLLLLSSFKNSFKDKKFVKNELRYGWLSL